MPATKCSGVSVWESLGVVRGNGSPAIGITIAVCVGCRLHLFSCTAGKGKGSVLIGTAGVDLSEVITVFWESVG